MSSWREFKKDIERFEMPDIGGIDGGTVQIILIVLVLLFLFRKLKSLFFLFLFAAAAYYIIAMS